MNTNNIYCDSKNKIYTNDYFEEELKSALNQDYIADLPDLPDCSTFDNDNMSQ